MSEIRYNGRMEQDNYEAYERLKTRLQCILDGKSYTNIMGVFGLNSGDVIGKLNDEALRKVVLLDNITYHGGEQEVYDDILAATLRYVVSVDSGGHNYYTHERLDSWTADIYATIDDAKYIPREYHYDESPLRSLTMLANNTTRDKRVKSLYDKINRHREFDNRDFKYLIIIELYDVNYSVLAQLEKLNSKNIIIVVRSMYKPKELGEIINKNSPIPVDGMRILEKFIPPFNWIISD